MTKRKSRNGKKRDIEQEVTDSIVAALEAGTAPWVKPWSGDGGEARQAVTNRPYRGINTLLLWMAEMFGGYSVSRWMTFNQVADIANKMAAKDLGRAVMAQAPEEGVSRKERYALRGFLREKCEEAGIDFDSKYPHVRKGESGTGIVFRTVKEIDKKDADGNVVRDEKGQVVKTNIFISRGYTVFNVEQVENLPASIAMSEEVPDEAPFDLDTELEAGLAQALPGLTWKVGGVRACYSPREDMIAMPDQERFKTLGDWYATKLHESVHSTGHQDRLNRKTLLTPNSDRAAYAREELVAEIGSAFLCAHLGIDGRLQHPSYIEMYLTALKNDKREIFRAASAAQKATDLILEGMGLAEADDPANTDQAQA